MSKKNLKQRDIASFFNVATYNKKESMPKPSSTKRPRKEVMDNSGDGDVEASPPAKIIKTDKNKPVQTPEEKKRTQTGNYFKYISRGGPKQLGAKSVPVGAPDCLKNLTFVLTGVLDSFERDDIVSMVTKFGGRVTSAVSGKTSYLIVGDEAGESKVNKAKALKISTLTEDEFLDLIRKSNPTQPSQTNSQFLGESEEDEDVAIAETKPSSTKRSRQAVMGRSSAESSPPAKISKTDKSKPVQTPEEKKRNQTSNYFKYISRGGPKHLGAKSVPVGAPDCLKNLTFVLTGVLDSFERDDIVSMVTKYGGRVTSAVSGKTSYLIVGEEAGESKINKAKSLKISTLTEDQFLDLIRKSNPNQTNESESQFLGESDEEVAVPKVVTPKKTSTKAKSITPTGASSKRSYGDVDSETEPKASKSGKSDKAPTVKPQPRKLDMDTKPSTATRTISTASSSSSATPSHVMWVDKYKPVLLKNIVGQFGEKSNANKLLKWLQGWFTYNINEKPRAAFFGKKDPEGKTFKAVLLSGPPGIGKTTTAHLCCKELGYDYFELNASDTRNKKGLHEMLSDSLTSQAIMGFKETSKRHVVIMDEVDGMSGNEDRGGIQELIGLLKISKVPIICICNDRMHPKIRSLANYCYDLRFNKPTFEQLKAMIQSICYKEKMKLPMESVQQLIASTDHDVRQILHQLQLIKESSVASDTLFDPKKDLRFGPWDVCRKVFSEREHDGMSLQDKSNLFFQDYSMVPLFVHENYAKSIPAAARGNKFKHMDCLKDAAESIATGDLVDSIIRRSQTWSLLPTQSIFSSILPGEKMMGSEISGIAFPAWLGQNSHKGKTSRLLQQIHNHVHLQVSGSLEALNMDYLPYLYRSIMNPLAKEDIATSVEVMHDYCLLREDLDYITEVALWPGLKNPMESLAVKVKTAFTKGVNKEQLVPYSVVKVQKKRGRQTEGEPEFDEEGLIEEDDEDEEEEIPEKDAMIKIRTSSKKKTEKNDKGAGSSKGSSSSSKKKSEKDDKEPGSSNRASASGKNSGKDDKQAGSSKGSSRTSSTSSKMSNSGKSGSSSRSKK